MTPDNGEPNKDLIADLNAPRNDVQALVGAAFGRLIDGGISVSEDDRNDVLQAGYVGALEAAQRWVPELGAFSTLVTIRAVGAMLNHLQLESGHGISHLHSMPLARYGDEDVTDIDELAGEREPLGARQVYDWTPEGFDPEAEANAVMVRRNISKLSEIQRRRLVLAFGFEGDGMSVADVAALEGVDESSIRESLERALVHLGYREAVSPPGWAYYRAEAFRRGAGATKASQPAGVLAGKPYRTGRNDLYDSREARITRVQNRSAWLAAGRQANGLAKPPV